MKKIFTSYKEGKKEKVKTTGEQQQEDKMTEEEGEIITKETLQTTKESAREEEQQPTEQESHQPTNESQRPTDEIQQPVEEGQLPTEELYDELRELEVRGKDLFREGKSDFEDTVKEKMQLIKEIRDDAIITELLELKSEVKDAQGFKVFCTALDSIEYAIPCFEKHDGVLSTIHDSVHQTLRQFDMEFLSMINPDSDESAKAEISKEKCFCLLEKALAEIEHVQERLESLEKEKVEIVIERNKKSLQSITHKVKQTCQQTQKDIEKSVKKTRSSVSSEETLTSSSCSSSKRSEELTNINKQLMELKEQKKKLKIRKRELETLEKNEEHIVRSRKKLDITVETLSTLTEKSERSVSVIEKIEEKYNVVFGRIEGSCVEQGTKTKKLLETTRQYKKKLLIYAIFLHGFMENNCYQNKEEAKNKIAGIKDKMIEAQHTLCREKVAQLKGDKYFTRLLSTSYHAKEEFYRTEHERFKTQLEEFEKKFPGVDIMFNTETFSTATFKELLESLKKKIRCDPKPSKKDLVDVLQKVQFFF